MVGGLAASSGLLMVSGMAWAAGAGTAAPASAPTVIERVVMIEIPAATGEVTPTTEEATAEPVTVIREVRVVPSTAPTPAPTPTQGS